VKKGYFSIFLVMVFSLVVQGCSSTPTVLVDEKQVQQQFKGQTVAQVLEATKVMMADAQQQALDFYSPGFFEVANKAFKEATFLILAPKEPAEDGDTSSDTGILIQLSRVQNSLAQATATKLEVQNRLQPILTVRDSLITKGINQSSEDEFKDLMASLETLFRRIEQNKLDGFAQSEKVTLLQFRRLEAQSVKAQQLDKIIAVLEQAEAIGAGGAAPKSYQKTQLALENAQAVIERDPNNLAAIKDAVARFSFETQHLWHVTVGVKELRALNDTAMENILLAAELRLLAIADALGVADPRQNNLRQQTEMLANAASNVAAANGRGTTKPRIRHINKNELDAAQLRIEQLQAQLRDKKAQNMQLKREKKPLVKRIEALERVVIKLNNEKAEVEVELARLVEQVAAPAKGVEITPIATP